MPRNYRYAILPGVGLASNAAAAVKAFSDGVTIVANDEKVQAVHATVGAGAGSGASSSGGGAVEQVLMMTVWPSTTATTVSAAGTKVTIPDPANGTLLTVVTSGAVTTFSAADPKNNAAGGSISFTIDTALEDLVVRDHDDEGRQLQQRGPVSCTKAEAQAEGGGGVGTNVTVVLPAGDQAGSTVSGTC